MTEFPAHLRYFPYTRVLVQKSPMQTGFSPFALAALTGRSPRRVLRELNKEAWYLTLLGCGFTGLPIVSLRSWRTHEPPPRSYNRYKAKIENYVDADFGSGSFKRLLDTYGGPDWREYCTRTFHLPGYPHKDPGPIAWEKMQEAFFSPKFK